MVRSAVPVRGGVCQMIVVVDAMRLFDGLPGPLHEPYETANKLVWLSLTNSAQVPI